MKPLIDPAFWSDPDIEAEKSAVKLTALWLITNSQTSLLGVCGASLSRFVFETGLTADALESTLKALPKSFIRVGTSVFVRNYIRHQFGTGEKLMRNNFFVALKSLFLSVKDQQMQSLILSEYPEFEQALAKPFKGLDKPKDGEIREDKEGKGSPEGKPKRAKAELAEVLEFFTAENLSRSDAEWFFHKCEGNGWRNGSNPIKDWKATVRAWRSGNYLPSQKNGGNGSSSKKPYEPNI